jgi:hypothetical protein
VNSGFSLWAPVKAKDVKGAHGNSGLTIQSVRFLIGDFASMSLF